jgi:N-acetylmuramoyl-L-alanine amidase
MQILGKSVATAKQMAKYLLMVNSNPKLSVDLQIEDFCQLYLDVCEQEGVRGDLAFAQACKETGNFKFNGDVMYTQNNFCGLGATGGVIGCVFKTISEGILAQAQHLKTYATNDQLNMPCVDPRRTSWFVKAKGGTSPNVESLGGTWAVPGYDTKKYKSLADANKARDSYGYQIIDILNRILSIKEGGTVMKKRVCIDAGHYGKYNRSPVVPEYYESDMTWKLHLMLKEYLEQYGIEVITTRNNKDKDLALFSRGMASKGCDLFLSLHSNACGSESVNYAAIYHLVNDLTTDIDDKSKDFANKIAPVIANVMGVGYRVLTRNAVSDRNHDGFSNDNYYGVLHGARMAGTPGLILEHSFHTNKAATLWLLNDSNLDKLARAEAKCIAEWLLDSSTPTINPTPAPAQVEINLVAKGYEYAKKFTGINETNLSKAKARVLQHALNLDYGKSIDEDGMFGPKSKAKLGSHYVKKGEKQYMVTAAEILMYLNNIDPNGVEYPGTYGNGLVKASKIKFSDDGLKITANEFLKLL